MRKGSRRSPRALIFRDFTGATWLGATFFLCLAPILNCAAVVSSLFGGSVASQLIVQSLQLHAKQPKQVSLA
jgi:hypothetical protein